MSKPNIIEIHPEPSGQGIVELLEHLLARAKAGEFSSLSVAYVYRDASVGCSWSRLPNQILMLGAISRLAHKLNRSADDA